MMMWQRAGALALWQRIGALAVRQKAGQLTRRARMTAKQKKSPLMKAGFKLYSLEEDSGDRCNYAGPAFICLIAI